MPRKAAVRGGWAASPPESSGSVSLLRAGLQPAARVQTSGLWNGALAAGSGGRQALQGRVGAGGGKWRILALELVSLGLGVRGKIGSDSCGSGRVGSGVLFAEVSCRRTEQCPSLSAGLGRILWDRVHGK